MKKYLCIVQILFFASILLSQPPEFIMPLWFEDAVGNKDTIWVGADDDANTDQVLDLEFGEELITAPFDSVLEVRAVNAYGATPWAGGYNFSKTIISGSSVPNHCFSQQGIGIFIHAKHWPIKIYWDTLLFDNNPYPCNANTILSPSRIPWSVPEPWIEVEYIECMVNIDHLYLDYDYPNIFPSSRLWTTYEIEGTGVDTIWGYFLYSFYGLPNSNSPCLTILPTEEILSPPKIQLFPNPARSWLQIEIDEGQMEDFISYEIYGIDGVQIQSNDYQSKIDIESLDSGVYVLLIKDVGGQMIVNSFVKM